jgi:hypothetical protein
MIMTIEKFYQTADSRRLDVSRINVLVMTPAEREAHLDAACLCCGNPTDVDCADYDDNGTCTSVFALLFCEGCSEHVPVEAKRKYWRRNPVVHSMITDRGNQLDWAIADQELRTAYIKGQHADSDLPF